MFTARNAALTGKIGFQATGAEQRKQLVLNVDRWLAELKPGQGSVAVGSRRP